MREAPRHSGSLDKDLLLQEAARLIERPGERAILQSGTITALIAPSRRQLLQLMVHWVSPLLEPMQDLSRFIDVYSKYWTANEVARNFLTYQWHHNGVSPRGSGSDRMLRSVSPLLCPGLRFETTLKSINTIVQKIETECTSNSGGIVVIDGLNDFCRLRSDYTEISHLKSAAAQSERAVLVTLLTSEADFIAPLRSQIDQTIQVS